MPCLTHLPMSRRAARISVRWRCSARNQHSGQTRPPRWSGTVTAGRRFHLTRGGRDSEKPSLSPHPLLRCHAFCCSATIAPQLTLYRNRGTLPWAPYRHAAKVTSHWVVDVVRPVSGSRVTWGTTSCVPLVFQYAVTRRLTEAQPVEVRDLLGVAPIGDYSPISRSRSAEPTAHMAMTRLGARGSVESADYAPPSSRSD